MRKAKLKMGDGITEREIAVYSGEDERANQGGHFIDLTDFDALAKLRALKPEALERMARAGKQALGAAGGSHFELRVSALAQWCDEVLARAGLIPGVERGFADSRENYASRMRWRIDLVRSAIKAGKADKAARYALELGQLISAFEVKHRWESHALRGEKVRRSADKGHEKAYGTREEKQARWHKLQQAVDEIMAANPTLHITQARKTVAHALGVSIRTLIKRTKNPRKKK